MIRKLTGSLLLALPFVALIAVSVIAIGVLGTIITFGICGIITGCIVAGVLLLEDL